MATATAAACRIVEFSSACFDSVLPISITGISAIALIYHLDRAISLNSWFLNVKNYNAKKKNYFSSLIAANTPAQLARNSLIVRNEFLTQVLEGCK